MGDDKTNRIKNGFASKGLLLLLGEVIAMGLVGAYSSTHFTFADSLSIVIAFAIAYLVPRFIYSNSKTACRWGQWMLLLVATAIAFYTVFSLIAGTPAADDTLEAPNLTADSGLYYCWALSHYDGRIPSPEITYSGVSIIMLGLWKVLGVRVVWPMAVNLMCVLLTMVMTGKIANRLLSHRFPNANPCNIVAMAMLMVALLGFFISQGMRIQKESYCSLGFALAGYALAGMNSTGVSAKEKRRDLVLFLVGTLIIAFIRTNFVYFIVVGAIMMSIANRCAHWKSGALMAIVALAMTLLFNYLFCYTLEHQLDMIEGGKAVARDFEMGISQQPYQYIIGEYYYRPKWERVFLLPISMGVQYIIPFPWLYGYDNASVLSLLPRMRMMWYFVGGMCLFYYLYIVVAHFNTFNLGMWAWWPLVVFMIMSFLTGGLVSRYALPIQPLFVVVATYVIFLIKEGHFRRQFTILMVIYVLVLVATLVFCYHSQVEYLRDQNILT